MNISDPAFHLETRVPLPQDRVHLWTSPRRPPAERRWEQMLSTDERSLAARFHFPRDRQFFTATRAMLRMMGGFLDSSPSELVLEYSEKEKHRCIRLPRQISWSSTCRTRDPPPSSPSRGGTAPPCRTFSLPSGITASFDARPERSPTSRRTGRACRFHFTNLTSP